MSRGLKVVPSFLLCGLMLLQALPARAAGVDQPAWLQPAVGFLTQQGALPRANLHPNAPMPRRDFKALMKDAFGGGYSRTRGMVTEGEVSAALVRALGKSSIAAKLDSLASPDGWHPKLGDRFGTEVVAREMGLRHDRSTSEERYEASVNEPITTGDAIWAVWKAKTSPSTYSADALESLSLPDLGDVRRKVVDYAFSLVGQPYVWSGESLGATSAGYPYGAQAHGGFDCSGFTWYVLRAAAPGWSPKDRPYDGWSLPQRSSADMAANTKDRLPYKKLRPADLLFFAPNGSKSPASAVYHVGIYLGHGWMIHSSGSRDGVSISQMGPGSYWSSQFAWGRRVVKG